MSIRDATISPDQIAEASAWVATLHGDNRTQETEQAFQRWLNDNPLNARAFEQITDLWEVTRNLPPRRVSFSRQRFTRSPLHAFALAASLLLIVAIGVVTYYKLQDPVIFTDTGEQRIVALEDGTQVTLNTNTFLTYHYDQERRHIDLEKGEALFEIAKDASRPFTVTAANHTITAIGTRFAVRNDERETTVTLIEGSVSVAGASSIVLSPGQRVILAGITPPKIDQPQLENALAWKRREVFLNETPLHEAMAEMNRYSKRQLTTKGSGTAEITVTGLFRAGDSLSFAHAVADTYHLQVMESASEIRLEPKASKKHLAPEMGSTQ